MLEDATYREWTSAFNETGSYYEGDWNPGSEIRFLGPDDEGSLGGMIATVEERGRMSSSPCDISVRSSAVWMTGPAMRRRNSSKPTKTIHSPKSKGDDSRGRA